jgi:hypothetical protein
MTAMKSIGRVVSLAGRHGAKGAVSLSREEMLPGSFAFVPASIIMDGDLTKSALRVGMLMAARADRATRECWLSTTTMAEMLGMARSSVVDALTLLVKRGHVRRRRRTYAGCGQTSSAYVLLFRPPDTPIFDQGEQSEGCEAVTTGTEDIPSCASASPIQSLDRPVGHRLVEKRGASCGEVTPGDRPVGDPPPKPGNHFCGTVNHPAVTAGPPVGEPNNYIKRN